MESTLAIAYKELKSEVGFFLGYGRGSDFDDVAYTTLQLADINSCIKGGMRRFYFPATEGLSHQWSFLKPVTRLTLLSGESSLRLPDDFGFLEGKVLVVDDESTLICSVPLMQHGYVRERLALYPTQTGPPTCAAWLPVKDTTAERGQRFDLKVYPIADQDYTLEVEYSLNPNFLTGSQPYAYGGPAHAETLVQACRAAAEQQLDDEIGVQTQLFEQRLAASLDMDRKVKAPLLGYNGDRSDDKYNRYGRRLLHYRPSTITFDGVEP